jgi:hypothetical protein
MAVLLLPRKLLQQMSNTGQSLLTPNNNIAKDCKHEQKNLEATNNKKMFQENFLM